VSTAPWGLGTQVATMSPTAMTMVAGAGVIVWDPAVAAIGVATIRRAPIDPHPRPGQHHRYRIAHEGRAAPEGIERPFTRVAANVAAQGSDLTAASGAWPTH
jgi:hypothetical protein